MITKKPAELDRALNETKFIWSRRSSWLN